MRVFAASHKFDNDEKWAEDIQSMSIALIVCADSKEEARKIAASKMESEASYHGYKGVTPEEIECFSEIKLGGSSGVIWESVDHG